MDSLALLCRSNAVNRGFRVALCIMLVFVAGLVVRQTVWTGYSVVLETRYSYCGASATANYIKAHDLTRCRIAGIREFVAAILPYFPENIFANFPNRRGQSFVDWHEWNPGLKYAFNSDGCLAESYDLLVWPEQELGDKLAAPWENPQMLSHLPANWRYVAYFPGQRIYKNRLTYYDGYALFAAKEVSERLGLSAGQFETAGREKQSVASAPLASKVIRGTAHLYLHFGDLLRWIDPEAALEQYRNFLAVKYQATDETELSSETNVPVPESVVTLMCLPKLKAAAHSRLGALFGAVPAACGNGTFVGGAATRLL